MNTLNLLLVASLTTLMTSIVIGQDSIPELVKREVNNHILDIDDRYPKTSMQSNRWYRAPSNVKTETIQYPRDEKVINHYSTNRMLLKSEWYTKDKPGSHFTYTYASDGNKLIQERGTYNLNYTHIDPYQYFAVNAEEESEGIYRYLDTFFVLLGKYSYEMRRKGGLMKNIDKRSVFRYTRLGQLESLYFFEHDVPVGHILNKFNDNSQVIEHQWFWSYEQFASEDTWHSLLSNHLYKFSYDSNGLISSLTKETYSPISRSWEVESQNFECTIEQDGTLFRAQCLTENCEYAIEIDKHGNWIRKQKYTEGEWTTSMRELIYYD